MTAARYPDDALCAQVDPALWFPEHGGSTQEARRICARCEVRAECLEEALLTMPEFGIYAGLSDRQRRKVARERRTA